MTKLGFELATPGSTDSCAIDYAMELGLKYSTENVDSEPVCLFVLRFYGPVNPMGSCRARSVYLTTRLLGRLSPLSG